jgi:flagellar motor switch protein FliG
VVLSRVQRARQDIMQLVRELDESGEIQLLLYEEPTVE